MTPKREKLAKAAQALQAIIQSGTCPNCGAPIMRHRYYPEQLWVCSQHAPAPFRLNPDKPHCNWVKDSTVLRYLNTSSK